MLAATLRISRRPFSTKSSFLAAAVTRKSFNKKNVYDKTKNRKGSGNDKNFADSILKNNYSKKAADKDLIEHLPSLQNNEGSLSKIVKYSDEGLKKLFIAGSFKPNQFNELYSSPTTLIRPIEDAKILKFYNSSLSSSSKNNRLILTGGKGVGKSTILAHFQALSVSNPSILLPISNADLLVDGSNDFKLNSETNLYDQPMFTKKFLKKFKNLNLDQISTIPLSENFTPLNSNFKKIDSLALNKEENKTLLDLVNLASSTNVNSTHIFTSLLKELSTQKLLPVYLTIDNFSAFVQYGMTKYRNADNNRIYFQNFTVANTLLNYVCGDSSFHNGAVVIATHGNHKLISNETIPAALNLIKPNNYLKFNNFDKNLANVLLKNGGLQNLQINRFSLDECKSLINHLWKFKLINNEYDAVREIELFGEEEFLNKIAARKFLLSGNGNPKLLLDSCVLSYA